MLTIQNFIYDLCISVERVSHTYIPMILSPDCASVSSLPQQPPAPIGPALSEALAKLLPDGISLETLNSQYLQKRSDHPPSVLASAKVLHLLGSETEEMENMLFDQLRPEFSLDVKVRDIRSGFHLLLTSS